MSSAQPPDARSSADWVKSGVIYEIYPRTFSPTGDFRGIEAQLPCPWIFGRMPLVFTMDGVPMLDNGMEAGGNHRVRGTGPVL